MYFLNALEKLYDELGFEEPDVLEDFRRGYLTENVCRNKRDVLWYTDECHNVAIYLDTNEFLSEEEIDEQLC